MTEEMQKFPVNMIDKIIKNPENYKLLEKIPLTIEGVDSHFPLVLNQPIPGEKTYSVVFLDTETTGLDYRTNVIIELGMVKATFSAQRKVILTVEKYYDEFEDPHCPIPPEIVELTHITNSMVSGKHFDEDMVAKFLTGRPLIVAHNAAFDRPFFEKRFPALSNFSWACSLKEVPWYEMDFQGAKLEYINSCIGYFYDAHRAYVDCLALLWIMYKIPKAFTSLVDSALAGSYRVTVSGNTFNFNDKLKQKGFRFNGTEKNWSRSYADSSEASKAKTALEDAYGGGGANLRIVIEEFKANTRYKK